LLISGGGWAGGGDSAWDRRWARGDSGVGPRWVRDESGAEDETVASAHGE